jgi:hypothetical protein
MDSPPQQPMLCHPLQMRHDLLGTLKETLRTLKNFDPAQNIIRPDESRKAARAAVIVRRDVLRAVYKDDYHTNSFEIDGLAKRVSQALDLIWFWGEAAEISALRSFLAAPADDPRLFAVGTVSVLPAHGIAGPGTGEICRSGSMDQVLGARGAGVERIVDFMSGAAWGRRYDSLFLTARNRASAPGVRGGEAVHRLHMQHVRSSFWGFAPWYVMQGGRLELLDLRECYRDPADVAAALAAPGGWWLAEEDDAQFVEGLCRLNFGFAPAMRLSQASRKREIYVEPGAALPEDIQQFNCVYLAVKPSGSIRLDHALRDAAALNACSIVVCVPLDEDAGAIQRAVAEHGFRLHGILPPRLGNIPRRALGYWCRVRSDLEMAPPFYMDRHTDSRDEARVCAFARSLCDRTGWG